MRRFTLTTAAVLAAVFLLLVGTLPPQPQRTSGQVDDAIASRTVAGAFHVHSVRSDGLGTADEIAAAAAAAGLRFVVLTDHGDGTRTPEPPAYRHGVLVIDAVEISTNGGHYIAIDMPAAPYPLGGEAAAVVEDVARLGGLGIVAHPDSPKPELAWDDWMEAFDGLEWLNVDSEWRDETRTRLLRLPFDYLLRSGPAIAATFDRPATLARWDRAIATRPVVGLAGHDAHGGIFEGAPGAWLRLPSYESSFRAFAARLLLRAPLGGAATEDARGVVEALRAGRGFTAIDAVAGPAVVDFRAEADGRTAVMGETLTPTATARLSFHTTMAAGMESVLLRDGAEVARSASDRLTYEAADAGAYRVEVRVPGPAGAGAPWIVTNPIYLRRPGPVSSPAPPIAGRAVASLVEEGAIEKDPESTASLEVAQGRRTLSFGLRPGDRQSQYVALVLELPTSVEPFDAVAFTARSQAPMRVSVQLRFNNRQAARWGRSIYVSPDEQRLVVPVTRLVAAEGPGPVPPAHQASSLLFVVDLTNARPGQTGRLELSSVSLVSDR